MPNMLKRIGVGVVLTLLAQVSILAVSGVGAWHRESGQCMFHADFSNSSSLRDYKHSNVSEFYALLPHMLITAAEIFINVTSKDIPKEILSITRMLSSPSSGLASYIAIFLYNMSNNYFQVWSFSMRSLRTRCAG